MLRRGLAPARVAAATAAASVTLLVLPALAAAHARVSPPVSVAGDQQLYSLVVPTEKSGLTTTRITMTVPSGFAIDSFVPPSRGWRMKVRSTGAGENAVVEQVTWTGGHTPTGEDSLFQFLAGAPAGTYTFDVKQTYSDGSIVDWNGRAGANTDAPAPTIIVKPSLGGGGGTSLVSIIALVVAVLALLASGVALAGRGGGSNGTAGRPLV